MNKQEVDSDIQTLYYTKIPLNVKYIIENDTATLSYAGESIVWQSCDSLFCMIYPEYEGVKFTELSLESQKLLLWKDMEELL